MRALIRIAPRFISTRHVLPTPVYYSARLFASKVMFVHDGLQFNEAVTSQTVLLIDEDKTKVGEMPLQQAIEHARAKGKDIVALTNVEKPGVPRVVKVVSMEAYQTEYRLKHDISPIPLAELKTVEVSSNISPADLDTKIAQFRRALLKSHPIQFNLKVAKEGSDILADKLLLETIITRLSDVAREKNFAQSWMQRKLLLEPGKPKAPYVPVKTKLPDSFVDEEGQPKKPKFVKGGGRFQHKKPKPLPGAADVVPPKPEVSDEEEAPFSVSPVKKKEVKSFQQKKGGPPKKGKK